MRDVVSIDRGDRLVGIALLPIVSAHTIFTDLSSLPASKRHAKCQRLLLLVVEKHSLHIVPVKKA